jgi:hypothetical protein
MLSHPLFDQRPFPSAVPKSVVASTVVAAQMRQSFAMTVIESLLAMQQGGVVVPGAPQPQDSFDDYVARTYVESRFGPQGLAEYLKLIPSALELMPQIEAGGWKVSPLSTSFSLKHVIPGGESPTYGQHLRLMSNAVTDAILGKGKRFIAIVAPYRHGKSIANAVTVPLWIFANFPHFRVGLACHNDALASRFSRMIRDGIIENQGKLGFTVSDTASSIHNFTTTAGGELWQRSIAGSIQGLGCDVLCIDEPYGSVDQANSQLQRDDVWNWYASALSRVEREGIIVFSTTRWGADDLYARIQSSYAGTDPDAWRFIHLPAIALEDNDCLGRRKGECLWPQVRTLEELRALEKSTPLIEWSRGYQGQIPEDLGIDAAYPSWSKSAIKSSKWDQRSAIHIGIDWNTKPMTAEMFMIFKRMLPHWTNKFETSAFGLDELCLDTSDMDVFAQALVNRVREHTRGMNVVLEFFYDQTANRSSVGLEENQTAVKLLKRAIATHKDKNMMVHWKDSISNPGVRRRVDVVDGMLKQSLLWVSPAQVELIKDFKGVRFKRDTAGRLTGALDKTSDLKRSHASDACGYCLVGTLASPYGEQRGSIPGLTY